MEAPMRSTFSRETAPRTTIDPDMLRQTARTRMDRRAPLGVAVMACLMLGLGVLGMTAAGDMAPQQQADARIAALALSQAR